MLDFLRGQKESIRRLCGGLELELEFYHKAPLEIDVGCFGLDDAGKLSDERYFIFYNQTQSPEGGILLHRGAATGAVRFHLRLDQLPPHIAKLSFTASIDGTRTMQELTKGHVCLFRGQEETARYSYDGSQFRAERAIVICELYRKGDDWRFNAVGRGFNGGLKALVEHFGGTVAESPPLLRFPIVRPFPRFRGPLFRPPTGRPQARPWCRISSPHFPPMSAPAWTTWPGNAAGTPNI